MTETLLKLGPEILVNEGGAGILHKPLASTDPGDHDDERHHQQRFHW